MEASEIIRRNEAVARFMGLEYTEATEEDCPHYTSGGVCPQTFLPEGLPFHQEWSWLMKAVDRIVIQAGFSYHVIRDDFGDGTFYKVDFDPEHYGSYIHGVLGYGKTMIDATFLAVSEYCLSLEA